MGPIVYERVEHGWKVPDSEREDWERRKRRLEDHPHGEPSRTKPKGARPLAELLAGLRGVLELDGSNEAGFRALYARDSDHATKLAARVIEGAASGRLDRPEGFLAWRLRELGSER